MLSTLPPINHGLGVALELPWSIYRVEFEGDAFKTGRVTGVPLYSARICASTFYKLLKINLRLFLGVNSF